MQLPVDFKREGRLRHFVPRAAFIAFFLTTLPPSPAVRSAAPPQSSARATVVLDTAIVRMGGAAALRRIERVRLEMITQWQRTSFEDRPYTDGPSYETHSDVRDYAVPAWRNTRRFPIGTGWREVTDVVRDSVAIRRAGASSAAWAPLNVAYVDERRELFTFAPERILLLARGASDLRSLADTSIGGIPHARVTATLGAFPTTLFFRRTDGFLAVARFRAAHPNDFGLVPFGEMEVELWYSRWQKIPPGIAYPMQWDVRRVGRPYKRITVVAATFDGAVAPADSFLVSDSLRTAFFAVANKPMHDIPLDSARIIDQRLASFGAFGSPAGAVKLGREWLLLEAGQAPLSVERAARWLERADSGTKVAGALVTLSQAANGGVAWLAAERVPTYVAPGAKPFVEAILRNHHQRVVTTAAIGSGRWIRVGGDSIWVEPIDLPNSPGSLLAYVPSLRWAYSAMAAFPLELDLVMARVRERGWTVERLGSMRGVAQPVPAAAVGGGRNGAFTGRP